MLFTKDHTSARLRQLTPCWVGFGACAFDPSNKWHDPKANHLLQTRLLWRTARPPMHRTPYVETDRELCVGDVIAAGPGWCSHDAWVMVALSFEALIKTADTAAGLLESEPLLPWIPERLRAMADHWRTISPPALDPLQHWPMDAHPEVLK